MQKPENAKPDGGRRTAENCKLASEYGSEHVGEIHTKGPQVPQVVIP